MTKHNLKESHPITEKETTKVCLSGSEGNERMNQTHRVDWMPVQSHVMQSDTVGVEKFLFCDSAKAVHSKTRNSSSSIDND